MYTVWKYEIEPDFVNQIIQMPKDATILSFGLDGNDQVCFWALVDDQAALEDHVFACVGTGWPLEQALNDQARFVSFIGTVTHGAYVWHLFDLGAGAAQEHFELVTQDSIKEAQPQ